ncbi:MAG: cell wall hydrolase [Proteobacteria bacterium]|nr:cell wall hydrolase [Pseudomonadota bacterium]
MSNIVNRAAAASVAAMLIFTLFSAGSSGAAAQDRAPVAPAAIGELPAAAPTTSPAEETAPQSLEALVAAQDMPADLSPELKCLAGAIYFEARSESLAGQLAVGRVIVARTQSGRFPDSYCGVVYQPSQFSFVRGRAMPEINTDSAMWQNAVAVARIADAGSWQSEAEGALFFHSARVAPHWRMRRIAQVDNHVFYR